MATNFIYKIEHDFGLAPNPFHGYCTLSVCKSDIRKNKNLTIDSWIFGIGCKTIYRIEGYFQKLIFCMKVEEKLSFNDYWNDNRFQCKKPVLNGSLVQMYGDNFYHKDMQDKWIQDNSAHSLDSGSQNEDHTKRDTSGEYVLVSQNFYYFGQMAIEIPEKFNAIIFTNARNFAFVKPEKSVSDFIGWLQINYQTGIHGDPISWTEHLQKP